MTNYIVKIIYNDYCALSRHEKEISDYLNNSPKRKLISMNTCYDPSALKYIVTTIVTAKEDK